MSAMFVFLYHPDTSRYVTHHEGRLRLGGAVPDHTAVFDLCDFQGNPYPEGAELRNGWEVSLRVRDGVNWLRRDASGELRFDAALFVPQCKFFIGEVDRTEEGRITSGERITLGNPASALAATPPAPASGGRSRGGLAGVLTEVAEDLVGAARGGVATVASVMDGGWTVVGQRVEWRSFAEVGQADSVFSLHAAPSIQAFTGPAEVRRRLTPSGQPSQAIDQLGEPFMVELSAPVPPGGLMAHVVSNAGFLTCPQEISLPEGAGRFSLPIGFGRMPSGCGDDVVFEAKLSTELEWRDKVATRVVPGTDMFEIALPRDTLDYAGNPASGYEISGSVRVVEDPASGAGRIAARGPGMIDRAAARRSSSWELRYKVSVQPSARHVDVKEQPTSDLRVGGPASYFRLTVHRRPQDLRGIRRTSVEVTFAPYWVPVGPVMRGQSRRKPPRFVKGGCFTVNFH